MTNEELMQKWVDELRSGKYLQGKFRFKTDEGHGVVSYCCLGVLAEAVLGVEVSQYGGEDNYRVVDEFLNPLGFDSWDFVIMNDEKGYTFEQIADYIKENMDHGK